MNIRLLGKETIVYAIGNVCTRGVSFLLIPIYTHALSIDDYGRLATLLFTVQILDSLMGMGSRTAFVRFAPDCNRQNQLGQLFASSIIVNVFGGLVIGGLAICFLPSLLRQVLHAEEVSEILIFASLAGMSQSLFSHLSSYYRTKNQSLKFVLVSISVPVLSTLLTVWFLFRLHLGIKGVLIAQVSAYGTLALFIMLDFFSKNWVWASVHLVWQVFRFGLPLTVVMSSHLVIDSAIIFFLSSFKNLEQVAIFSLAYKLAQIVNMVLILPFQMAYEPFVFANIRTPGIQEMISRVLTYLMLGFAFIAFALVFFCRDIFQFIAPPAYFSAYPILFLLIPSVAFHGIYYIGESLLHIKGKTNVTGTWGFVIAAVNILLSYLIVPKWGITGAIVIVNATYVMSALIILVEGILVFPIRLEIGRLLAILVLAIGLLLSVYLLRETVGIVYYIINPLVACMSTWLLYVSGFFNDQEIQVIRSIKSRAAIRAWVHSQKVNTH